MTGKNIAAIGGSVNFFDLVFFLLGLGFNEVMVKPLAMMLFRRSFKLLPKLFDKLDPILPDGIAKLTPSELEATIYSTIEGTAEEESCKLSEGEKKALFNEFLRLYNPVTASAKVSPKG